MGSTYSAVETKKEDLVIIETKTKEAEYLSIDGGNMKGPIVLSNQTSAIGAQLSMATSTGPIITNTEDRRSLAGVIIGNNILAAKTLPPGSGLKFVSTCTLISSKVNDSLTFSITIDENTIWSYIMPLNGESNLRIKFQVDIVSNQANSIQADGIIFMPGRHPVMKTNFSAFNPTVEHALDFNAQWSSASTVNQVQSTLIHCTRVF